MISVLVLTLNEEANLSDCLHSVPWKQDIHVLDSGSGDRTQEIAKSLGAQVHVRAFTNYAEQRNAGLALPFVFDWVLMIDADERVTPGLAKEVELAVADADPSTAFFRVRRQDIFEGSWIKRASGYPTWFPRVFRLGRVRVQRDVNEEYVPIGSIGVLRNHLLHLPFNKGEAWWLKRHERYAAMEAEVLTAQPRLSLGHALALASSTDPSERRKGLKAIVYRIPGRPALVFAYLYLVRLGFLDGRAGLKFCALRFKYERMISANIRSRRGRVASVS